jgi:hypothetical protein
LGDTRCEFIPKTNRFFIRAHSVCCYLWRKTSQGLKVFPDNSVVNAFSLNQLNLRLRRMDCFLLESGGSVNEERQFRLFSIAILGLVAVVALKAGATNKRRVLNFQDPSLSVQEFTKQADNQTETKIELPPAMPELEAVQEIERINANEYSAAQVGQSVKRPVNQSKVTRK